MGDFLRGKDGVVKFDAGAIGHVQSWNLDTTAEVLTGWGMGDDWQKARGSIKSWTGSVEVYLDPTDAAAPDLGDTVTLDLFPGGEASGATYYTGQAVITGTPRTGSKDGIPTLTFNFTGSGPLGSMTVTP